jgi:hypothetical protein
MRNPRKARSERVELAVADLLYRAELYAAVPDHTLHDRKMQRLYLLEAAREYGNAMRRLSMP